MFVSNKMFNLWLDMAEYMLACGAEIYRIEDTLTRVGKSYGAERMEVFVITSSIVVTAEGDGWQYTSTRRLRTPSGSDFIKLEDINALARRICRQPLSEGVLEGELRSISARPVSFIKTLTGSALAAFSFTLFFGGSLPDAAFSALFGIIVCLMMVFCTRKKLNRFSVYFFVSVFSGALICLLSEFIPMLKPDKIIVGVIMLTIPGVATTNSIRDMLTGDTISGTIRLIQSLLEALVLAGSYMFAVWLTKGSVTYSGANDGLYQILPAIGGSVGFAMLFNCRKKYVLFSIPGGAISWLIYLGAEFHLGMGVFACSLISALVGSLLAEICARLFKAPATLFLIPFVIPLVPGSSLFYSFSTLIGETPGAFAMNTVNAVLGIAIGTGIIASLFSLRLRRN